MASHWRRYELGRATGRLSEVSQLCLFLCYSHKHYQLSPHAGIKHGITFVQRHESFHIDLYARICNCLIYGTYRT